MKVLVVGSGGARACARLEARVANAAVSRSRLRARQRRHRRDVAHGSRSTPAILEALARLRRTRSASISPSSVPSSRSIAASSICSRRAARASSGRRAPRRSSSAARSFAKAFMARHGIPTARYRACDDRGERVRGAWRRASSASRSSSRPTDSPPARASSSRADRGDGRSRDARGDGGAAVRRRRRAGRARGVPERARKCPSSRSATAGAPCRCMSAQDHKRVFDGDRGAEHRRHGRVLAEPARRRGDADARSCARSSSPCVARAARGGHRIPRLSLCRPDADLRRSQGDRVQRAVRRSGSAGRHPGDRRPIWRRASRPRPTARSRRRRVAFRTEPHVGVVLAARGLSRSGDRRRADRGLDAASGLDGRARCSTPARRAGAMTIVTAGGRVLTVVGRGPTSRPRSRAPTPASSAIIVRRHAVPPRHRPQGASDRMTAAAR